MVYFPEVEESVVFDGPRSHNQLAFKHYEAERRIGDRTMAEHLRFAVCFWHTFKGTGSDPFGAPTLVRPWDRASDPMRRAMDTMDAAFEFFVKLGTPFWCFHDRDIAPEGESFTDSCERLSRMVTYAKRKQDDTGVRLLWGTANLFSHPRYQNGAATCPDPHVFAYAAGQVKHALEATHELKGSGYVFWGGREGYETLLNTDMQRERDQLARFLWMAVEHAESIGFEGQLYIEPKPNEPTKHQYDSDAASCLNFLREYGLMGHLKLNLETNHATLAGHSMPHELRVARNAGALGSIDANVGDELLGWDTDQFLTDPRLATLIMLEVLAMGGFTTGGLNFDAKVRRSSHETVDLFHGHIGSMDAFARGLVAAHAIRQDGRLDALLEERYAAWNGDLGKRILAGGASLADCAAFVSRSGEPVRKSGRQELLESILAEFV
jgi:xylose isomerase